MTDHNYADRTWFQPPQEPGSAIGRALMLLMLTLAAAFGYGLVILVLSFA